MTTRPTPEALAFLAAANARYHAARVELERLEREYSAITDTHNPAAIGAAWAAVEQATEVKNARWQTLNTAHAIVQESRHE